MSKNLFITGTGTDVGKTFVTALIVKKLTQNNKKAAYYTCKIILLTLLSYSLEVTVKKVSP